MSRRKATSEQTSEDNNNSDMNIGEVGSNKGNTDERDSTESAAKDTITIANQNFHLPSDPTVLQKHLETIQQRQVFHRLGSTSTNNSNSSNNSSNNTNTNSNNTNTIDTVNPQVNPQANSLANSQVNPQVNSQVFCLSQSLCRHGHPQAFGFHPTNGPKLSSGLFRLSCPLLVKAVDEWEDGSAGSTGGVGGVGSAEDGQVSSRGSMGGGGGVRELSDWLRMGDGVNVVNGVNGKSSKSIKSIKSISGDAGGGDGGDGGDINDGGDRGGVESGASVNNINTINTVDNWRMHGYALANEQNQQIRTALVDGAFEAAVASNVDVPDGQLEGKNTHETLSETHSETPSETHSKTLSETDSETHSKGRQTLIQKLGPFNAQKFLESGVAGIPSHQTWDVKCIHAHVADHLCRCSPAASTTTAATTASSNASPSASSNTSPSATSNASPSTSSNPSSIDEYLKHNLHDGNVIGRYALYILEHKRGVPIRGNDVCWQQCNVNCPPPKREGGEGGGEGEEGEGRGWWYVPKKNRQGLRSTRRRRKEMQRESGE